MSEDLIRRSDAIKAIANLHILADEEEIFRVYANNPHSMTTDFEGTLIDAINAIKSIPSADRPQEWIPCSERLPKEKEVVAVIIKQWGTDEIKKGITYRVDRNMWVGFGRHNEACVWWLPLPPWKGADDEL